MTLDATGPRHGRAGDGRMNDCSVGCGLGLAASPWPKQRGELAAQPFEGNGPSGV
jgi:hypothetical protein